MIVNTTIDVLLRPPPEVPADWKIKLTRWLSAIAGTSFRAVFESQLEMLAEILSLEKQIKAKESDRKSLKREIPPLKSAGNYDQIRRNQESISALECEAERLRYLRECVLFVGDTIAAHLLEPDAIKHFAAHRPAGFLSGKEGLEAEVDAMRHFCVSEGYLVLLNDLTHSIRLGDLTLKKGEEIRTFEVKASVEGYKSAETARQILAPIMIHDYMKRDVVNHPIALPDGRRAEGMVRVNSGVKEDWHDKVAGMLYQELRGKEFAHVELGKKHYFACKARNIYALRSHFEQFTQSDEWVVANARRRVTYYPDIPPFSLWFKPETCTEILSGELIILSAFSVSDLNQLFSENGIKVEWKRRQDDLFPIRLIPSREPDTVSDPENFELESSVQVGEWQRLRVLYSFLSLESFVHICSFLISPEGFAKLKAKIDESRRIRSEAERGKSAGHAPATATEESSES